MSTNPTLTNEAGPAEKAATLGQLREARASLRRSEAGFRDAREHLDGAYRDARRAGWTDRELAEFG